MAAGESRVRRELHSSAGTAERTARPAPLMTDAEVSELRPVKHESLNSHYRH